MNTQRFEICLMAWAFFSLSMHPQVSAAENKIVNVYPKVCEHGLREREGRDFAVFVFCDDGLGTQIGIVLARPGGGSVQEDTQWSVYNRFWQDFAPWMSDVMQIAWSPSGNRLYVVTGEVYSNASLYELDLPSRTAKEILTGRGKDGWIFLDIQMEKMEDDHVLVSAVPDADMERLWEDEELKGREGRRIWRIFGFRD